MRLMYRFHETVKCHPHNLPKYFTSPMSDFCY